LLLPLENATIDQRFGLRGKQDPDERIAIVQLDQRSLSQIGERPPIQRKYYAELLDRLAQAKPRLIALDVQFIGATDPANDDALVDAIQRHGPVLLATHDGPGGLLPVPAGRRGVPGAVLASVGIDVDGDGVLRRIIYAPVATKSFPVKAAELVTGKDVPDRKFPDNHAYIDFAGPPGTFPSYSFIDVLQRRVPPAALADKIVLVGITDPAERDVFVTAVSSVPMSGVEIHANSLATILSGLRLRVPGLTITFGILLVLAAAPTLLAKRIPGLFLLGAGFAILILYLACAQLAFSFKLLLPILPAVVTLGIATSAAAAIDSLSEKRRRRALEATLGEIPTQLDPVFFISYRRDQSSWPAQSIKAALKERFGDATVFMDMESIHAGQDWQAKIREAIRSCSTMLVLIGPYWLGATTVRGSRRIDDPDDWVRREVEEGLNAPGVSVIPILLDGARIPEEEDLPPSLADLTRRNAHTLSAVGWSVELTELLDSLRAGRIEDAIRRRKRP
jgi:CHASE2 domain-containing sensor protein